MKLTNKLSKKLVFLSSIALPAATAVSYAGPQIPGQMVSSGRKAPAAVAIHFASFGEGIDRLAKVAIDQLILRYQVSGDVTTVKDLFWGREGETSVCVQFNSLKVFGEAEKEIAEIVELSQLNGDITNSNVLHTCENLTVPGLQPAD